LTVSAAHLRHACEVQARSHLLHLREGYLETYGRGDRVADLIVRSAKPLSALVTNVVRLQGSEHDGIEAARLVEHRVGLSADSLAAGARLAGGLTLPPDDARRILPTYLEAVEQLTLYIDQWRDPA
jgi:hypothetical protein